MFSFILEFEKTIMIQYLFNVIVVLMFKQSLFGWG